MPFSIAREDFSQTIQVLQLLKLCHTRGIYHDVVRNSPEVGEDDIYELSEIAIEYAAPIFDIIDYYYLFDKDEWIMAEDVEEFDSSKVDVEDPHRVFCFSSPSMQEYYRICRLLEWRDGVKPENNPPVREAHRLFCNRFAYNREFWTFFNDDYHTTDMRIETAAQYGYDPYDILMGIWSQLDYYDSELPKLRLTLLMGPPVSLPLLPTPEGGTMTHG